MRRVFGPTLGPIVNGSEPYLAVYDGRETVNDG